MVTQEELINAGRETYEKLTTSEKNLINFIMIKVQQCIEGQQEALFSGDTQRVVLLTSTANRLLEHARKLGEKYPA